LYDHTAQQLFLRLAALILLIAVQGGAVAAAAVALGDKGVRHDGRLSLNPLTHLDLIGLVSALFFSIGWAKTVAIEPAALRGGRAALLLPVVAGFLATLGLVLLLVVARAALLPLLPDSAAETLYAFVTVAGPLGIAFALANLLPLPPFTGGLLLLAVKPDSARLLRRAQLYAGLLVLALSAFGLLQGLVAPAERPLAWLLLRQ